MKQLPRDALVSQADLEARGIVPNTTTRRRWQKALAFPEGFMISPAARRWWWGSILDWLDERARLTAGQTHAPPSPAAHAARDRARTRKRSRRRRKRPAPAALTAENAEPP